MNVYRIKSTSLRVRGERFESADKVRAERRLAVILKEDPKAKLLTIRTEGR